MSHIWFPLDMRLAEIGLLIAVLGLMLGALTWTRWGWSFDQSLFWAINRRPPHPAVDWAMWSVTHFGSAWAGVGTLSFAFLVRHPRFGLVTSLAVLTVGIVIGVAKSLSQRPRPFAQLTGVRVVGLKPADLSYPSGHSAMAFNIATLLALGLPLNGIGRVAVYLVASAVAYSRLHLGVHYPSDVLSGAAVGTGWGLLWTSYLHR